MRLEPLTFEGKGLPGTALEQCGSSTSHLPWRWKLEEGRQRASCEEAFASVVREQAESINGSVASGDSAHVLLLKKRNHKCPVVHLSSDDCPFVH